MKLAGAGKLLRIFIGEADRVDGHMLSETIVRKARERGLAGATVIRGIEGFGAASRIHTAKILRLSEDLPIVVEIVDTEEHITEFLPFVEELFQRSDSGGMITLEKAEVIHYTSGKSTSTSLS
jgi:PII-like signaling protein